MECPSLLMPLSRMVKYGFGIEYVEGCFAFFFLVLAKKNQPIESFVWQTRVLRNACEIAWKIVETLKPLKLYFGSIWYCDDRRFWKQELKKKSFGIHIFLRIRKIESTKGFWNVKKLQCEKSPRNRIIRKKHEKLENLFISLQLSQVHKIVIEKNLGFLKCLLLIDKIIFALVYKLKVEDYSRAKSFSFLLSQWHEFELIYILDVKSNIIKICENT